MIEMKLTAEEVEAIRKMRAKAEEERSEQRAIIDLLRGAADCLEWKMKNSYSLSTQDYIDVMDLDAHQVRAAMVAVPELLNTASRYKLPRVPDAKS